MEKLNFILILGLCSFMLSCNQYQRFIIENNSGKEIYIKVFFLKIVVIIFLIFISNKMNLMDGNLRKIL